MVIKDGDWRLLHWDPATNQSTWKMYDGEKTVIRVDCPVDQLVKANTEERNATAGERWGDWRKIASIPTNVWWDKLNPAVAQHDDKYIKRWLNDGDNRAFRTFDGQV